VQADIGESDEWEEGWTELDVAMLKVGVAMNVLVGLCIWVVWGTRVALGLVFLFGVLSALIGLREVVLDNIFSWRAFLVSAGARTRALTRQGLFQFLCLFLGQRMYERVLYPMVADAWHEWYEAGTTGNTALQLRIRLLTPLLLLRAVLAYQLVSLVRLARGVF